MISVSVFTLYTYYRVALIFKLYLKLYVAADGKFKAVFVVAAVDS